MKLGDLLAPENGRPTSMAEGASSARFPAASRKKSSRPTVESDLLALARDSRRYFFRAASAALGGIAVWIMNRSARRWDSLPEATERTIVVPWNSAPGIYSYDRVIVVNSSGGVTVLSATCTHLGCRITCTESAELVCPCHGSRFNLQGEVTHGPAGRPLRALPFQMDRAGGRLHVTLESSHT